MTGDAEMAYLKPNKYYKDIYSIDYNKLKSEGIKCLVFDLDNTLGLITNRKCPDKTRELLRSLQEDFSIFICSNNIKRRLSPYLRDLGVGGVSFSMKPLTRGLNKIKTDYQFNKNEMVMIGDQIVTDVLAGKRFRIKTILVDPLGSSDLKITGINRIIENKILKKYKSHNVFERGKYYE